ncbi:MAG: ATP synthase subunit I [Firmicutes bacterium]|nr:ATP synthase subunit I [Bacillota bacterium]
MRDWDFESLLARTLRLSAGLVVFFCLSLLTRPKDPVVMGFITGTAVGIWNAYFLARRMRSIAGMAVPKAKAQMRVGFALRLSIVVLVLFFIARNPSLHINIYAAAAGMFIVPCLFTFGAAGMLIRENRALKYNRAGNGNVPDGR